MESVPMKPTIMIDAGHGGYDNGATHNGRKEKDDTLRLALAVGEKLQQEGFPVKYTRTTDVYQSPTQKARIANESGADYFVSIHRNAAQRPNMYDGVQTLVFRDSGIPAKLARSVNEELEEVGFRNLGVEVRPELAVLRRTRMPAILIEAGFIDSDKDNQIFDEKFDEMAEAIADGIEDVVGEDDPKQYGVQVGLYRRYENAEYAVNQLLQQGYTAQIKPWKQYYAVIVGAENSLEDARTLERQLSAQGYSTLIVEL